MQGEGRTLKIPFPATEGVGGRRSLQCRSLLDTDISGSRDKSLTNGIEGKVVPGQDSVIVSVRGSVLTFMSGAAQGSGVVRGDDFTILKDSESELVAYLFNGASMNSFVLNKTNGLAIWSKIRSTFPVYDAPTGAASYLQCR